MKRGQEGLRLKPGLTSLRFQEKQKNGGRGREGTAGDVGDEMQRCPVWTQVKKMREKVEVTGCVSCCGEVEQGEDQEVTIRFAHHGSIGDFTRAVLVLG